MVKLEVYWSRGAGTAKRRSIRFALIFLLLFLSRKKEEEKKAFANGSIRNNCVPLFPFSFP